MDSEKFTNSRAPHEISILFKNEDKNYTGTDEKDINKTIDLYKTKAKDCMLNDAQKLQFFHYGFHEE